MNENKANLDFLFGLNYAVDMLNRSFPDANNLKDFTLDEDAVTQVLVATGLLIEALETLVGEEQ